MLRHRLQDAVHQVQKRQLLWRWALQEAGCMVHEGNVSPANAAAWSTRAGPWRGAYMVI